MEDSWIYINILISFQIDYGRAWAIILWDGSLKRDPIRPFFNRTFASNPGEKTMSPRVLFIAAFCFAGSALAQTAEFDLVSPSGKKVGPFKFRDGQSIRFGDKVYKIQIRRKSKISVAK